MNGKVDLTTLTPEEFNKKMRHRRVLIKLKKQTLQKYCDGEIKCACCGETRIEFLVIDHIDGGGNQHRKITKGGGSQTYRWLKNNNYPEGFRILCCSCNQSLGYYGYCPHQRERGEEIIEYIQPSKVIPYISEVKERLLKAAIEIHSKGIYPSVSILRKLFKSSNISKLRNELMEEGKWPVNYKLKGGHDSQFARVLETCDLKEKIIEPPESQEKINSRRDSIFLAASELHKNGFYPSLTLMKIILPVTQHQIIKCRDQCMLEGKWPGGEVKNMGGSPGLKYAGEERQRLGRLLKELKIKFSNIGTGGTKCDIGEKLINTEISKEAIVENPVKTQENSVNLSVTWTGGKPKFSTAN